MLAIPVVLYSEMVQEWLRFTMPTFPGSDLIPPVLGTAIFLYGGWVFLTGGLSEIQTRKPGMMLLISLAITVAFVASAATTLGLFDLEFWWELALLVVIMLLGHWLEMRALGQAQGALSALAALLPDEAERVTGNGVETVPLSALRTGDVVLVRPGARVPADGEIVDGEAEFDESMITGESRPVDKAVGDRLVAGTVASGSAVRVRVDAVGEATALAGIQRLVEQAQQSRSRAQALADRFAAALFYIAVGAGIVTFTVWSLLGEVDTAVTRTVTVLVISCPHALGLAIPLVIALSTSLSARQGILVKDRLALERMRLVDTVLFDKTGTLTRGEHAVTGIAAIDGDEDGLLRLAAAVEADSEHPLARAIVGAAEARHLAIPGASAFRATSGRGVEATVEGRAVAVGGPVLLRERGISVPDALTEQTGPWAQRGAAVLHVIADGQPIGALALEDDIRPESREAVDALHRANVRVVMITGDARQVAEAVARDLGIDEVFAEVLPEDKDGKVAELQARGEKVAMIGDGVNDAPALARADVGIAIGAGTDVAIESAGVILASSDPRSVVGVIRLSRASYQKMVQNLGWAAGYNLIAIPLAAGVLAPLGFVLAPAVGAVLMSLSTIVVALNAQLLRRLDLRP
ncbi:MAG: Lead, cadmium, zinc and mercury transporting ATPase; Copper-translocating P-type ATPase [uncultured Thermomicrobiales bacterium]|uniref:Lead, cadmium, zinc and mercury transporting ATPase Copper-translocating P-type ATPase n=1 Tax=uncultured Thermomicrobiales bacterium TaxID=1645740 RepID=A0A6J4UM92_9BACT|nr:MAG: Lead, cadmium, zinc and mercury transporting ATPase; Copper-translocating P-type ATPase [uncultured Thermomicrobiales bacterium]